MESLIIGIHGGMFMGGGFRDRRLPADRRASSGSKTLSQSFWGRQTLLTACMGALVGSACALVFIESHPPTAYEIHLPLRTSAATQVPGLTGPDPGEASGQGNSQTRPPGNGETQNDTASDARFDYYSEGGYALPRAQYQEPPLMVKPQLARR